MISFDMRKAPSTYGILAYSILAFLVIISSITTSVNKMPNYYFVYFFYYLLI